MLPLSTLCPPCAKEDVESAEERIEGRQRDVGGLVGPEWEEWCVQIQRDREMEVEFWEGAQERAVREKTGSVAVIAAQPEKTEKAGKKKKSKMLGKRGVCVVM